MSRYSDLKVDIDSVRAALRWCNRKYIPTAHYYIVDNIRREWKEAAGDLLPGLDDTAVWAAYCYAMQFDPENVGRDNEDEVILDVISGQLKVGSR